MICSAEICSKGADQNNRVCIFGFQRERKEEREVVLTIRNLKTGIYQREDFDEGTRSPSIYYHLLHDELVCSLYNTSLLLHIPFSYRETT